LTLHLLRSLLGKRGLERLAGSRDGSSLSFIYIYRYAFRPLWPKTHFRDSLKLSEKNKSRQNRDFYIIVTWVTKVFYVWAKHYIGKPLLLLCAIINVCLTSFFFFFKRVLIELCAVLGQSYGGREISYFLVNDFWCVCYNYLNVLTHS
jgi:hypothetical protein